MKQKKQLKFITQIHRPKRTSRTRQVSQTAESFMAPSENSCLYLKFYVWKTEIFAHPHYYTLSLPGLEKGKVFDHDQHV